MTEEIAKLREIIETDRNASNDNNWQGDREKQLLDKIDELESHRRKLLDDVQDYKNDLKTLVIFQMKNFVLENIVIIERRYTKR